MASIFDHLARTCALLLFRPAALRPFGIVGTGAAILLARLSAADPVAPAAPLPELLVAADGTKVTNAAAWETDRRDEVLELFRRHVYGRAPVGRPADLRFEAMGEPKPVFDGTGIQHRTRIIYTGPGGQGVIGATLFVPAGIPPRGCFVLIVNRSRRIVDDAAAAPAEFWPVDAIVARGYATVAFHYSDVAVDSAERCFQSGAFRVFGPAQRTADSWGAISAWAWGASRVVDYLETVPALAGCPVAVIGHSRGGKTALWCGAQDTRIALAISNESGAAGAALARRTAGETIEASTRVFPYWYAMQYMAYAGREADLPVDQHMLLALMAPRRVYVASAQEDSWADPSAEFAACIAAQPVLALYGREGVGEPTFPRVGTPRHQGLIGYHVRAGGHDLRREDWRHFMDYWDRCARVGQ